MATRSKKTTTIPTFRQIEKQVGRLRKDLERTVDRVGREAVRYIPKSSRRQFGDILERVNDLGETVSKRVTKTVKGVRADVEDTVDDLRGTVDKRVKALRKDATETSQKALETIEKETRKQVERLLGAIGLPLRSDFDGIKRRIGALERQVEQLVEGTLRKRAKHDESQAA
ncbi:MAG: phasin family protein [Candidatus Binatia bacterium]